MYQQVHLPLRTHATAHSHAMMIGPPRWMETPPFPVREKLDSGHVIWRHHRRCTDE